MVLLNKTRHRAFKDPRDSELQFRMRNTAAVCYTTANLDQLNPLTFNNSNNLYSLRSCVHQKFKRIFSE